jgi:uncharacterized membrane protein YdjX (TVP38/TMEM64 family)
MRGKAALLLLLVLAAAGAYALGLNRYLTLAGLQAHYGEWLAFYRREPALVIGGFVALQVTALALCVPGAVLTFALAAGALFGPGWGTLIVLVSLTMGDSAGFLLARYLLRGWVRSRFAAQFETIDRGVERDGWLYLLALRLMAAMPYFVVNLTMALTRMRLRTFAPVSFLGLIPATAIYVNAGTALTQIESPGDILSLRLMLALGALGLLPIAARWAFRRRLAL